MVFRSSSFSSSSNTPPSSSSSSPSSTQSSFNFPSNKPSYLNEPSSSHNDKPSSSNTPTYTWTVPGYKPGQWFRPRKCKESTIQQTIDVSGRALELALESIVVSSQHDSKGRSLEDDCEDEDDDDTKGEVPDVEERDSSRGCQQCNGVKCAEPGYAGIYTDRCGLL